MLNNEPRNQIAFCFLDSYDSTLEAIKSTIGISKSQIKKYKLSAKFLNRTIQSKREIALPLDLVNNNMINPEYEGDRLPLILKKDETFISVSKPFKIHSHPHTYQEKNNLLSFLRAEGYEQELKVNCASYDRGLLYRIDFETSGLMLYIRNEADYLKYRENFISLVLEKKYLAVVEGKYTGCGDLQHHIKYTGTKNSKGEVCNSDSTAHSFLANSYIKVIDYNLSQDISLVLLTLKQGLRHQLRIQMAGIGHPIMGDTLYGGRKAQRMYLHCWKYQVKKIDSVEEYIDPNFELLKDLFCFDC